MDNYNKHKKYEPIFGAWYLSRLLGKGSFGEVYEITREEYGTTYKAALKVISVPQDEDDIKTRMTEGTDIGTISEYYEGVLKEIVNENEIMSKLKGNSNIVSYEDHQIIAHEDGIGYDILIRMELLTPLIDKMLESKLDEREVVRIGIDMCKALELCHRKSIIHRDIKPQNIFLSENGDYKLGDFGIARTIEKTTGGLSRKGTYNYMAPEVLRGDNYGATADIYSLGVVLYTLLNGNRLPFLPAAPEKITPPKEEAARKRRFNGEPLPAPIYASGLLGHIVLKACEPDSSDRYESASQMRTDLEIYYDRYTDSRMKSVDEGNAKTVVDWRGEIPVPPEPRPVPGPGPRPPAPTRLIITLFVGLAVLSIGFACMTFLMGKNDDGDKPEHLVNSNNLINIESGGDSEANVDAPNEEGAKTPDYMLDAEEFNGHYYKIVDTPMRWKDAQKNCEQMNGHLVTIASQGEQDFVADLVARKGTKYNYWLGGTDDAEEGVWEWVTGEPWSYSNWRKYQPNNSNSDDEDGDQNYVHLGCGSGPEDGDRYMKWWDAPNSGISKGSEEAPTYKTTYYFGFICEWDDIEY